MLSKSLVSDPVARVEDFVNAIRKHDNRWNGMCDSLEFLEFLIDRLERLVESSICRITQRSSFVLQCGHEGVIDDKDSREHYLYHEQLASPNSQSSMEYRCSKCPPACVTTANCITTIRDLPPMLIVVLNQEPDSISTNV